MDWMILTNDFKSPIKKSNYCKNSYDELLQKWVEPSDSEEKKSGVLKIILTHKFNRKRT